MLIRLPTRRRVCGRSNLLGRLHGVRVLGNVTGNDHLARCTNSHQSQILPPPTAGARERKRLIAKLRELKSEMLLLAEAERDGFWIPAWKDRPSLVAQEA